MSLTVGEILSLPGLEDMVLRAGGGELGRNVRWSYVAENEGIADWVMGGELVFVTGINHPRDEANLLQLVHEGHASGIAGLVILTGDAFIQRIPEAVVGLAEQLGLPLIEQPYLLKMVFVSHLIGTSLVQMAQVKRSRHDVLGQLLSGDYPSLSIVRQRAEHLGLELEGPRRLLALRLSGLDRLFDDRAPDQAEQTLQQTRERLLARLEQWNAAQPAALPVVVQGDLFVLLPGDTPQLRQALAELHVTLRSLIGPLTVFIGLASRVEQCAAFRQALSEARQALDAAERMRPAAGLCDFSELGVLRLLQAIPEGGVVDAFMHQILGPLMEPQRRRPHVLLDTLDALLQENGNALKAAQRLGVHRNTFNQRLLRIEQQSGHSLDDANFRLNA